MFSVFTIPQNETLLAPVCVLLHCTFPNHSPICAKVNFSCVSQKDSELILLHFPIQTTLFLTLVCDKQINTKPPNKY